MDEAERFVGWLTLGIFVLLVLVVSLSSDLYSHPMPDKDCSKAFIYPICSRSYVPATATPPTTVAVYLSVLLAIILVIILIYISYHASVIEQKQLVTGIVQVTPPTAQPTQGVDPKAVK